MGGGVGGMVYSIKNDRNGSEEFIFSHANHRGDVIARSNSSKELTSFALYEAYGTRPCEWGSDPDRQKANTKEEESDLGLLNEGMRFRDLETGTWLTRDPQGYGDGPNLYCYVHCNPITQFDAFGLETARISESTGVFTSSHVQYPTAGDTGYNSAGGASVQNGVPMVMARDSSTFMGGTTSDSGMRQRPANMDSLEARSFTKDKDGNYQVKGVDQANDVSLKGPDLVTFSKEAGKHSDQVETAGKVMVELLPIPGPACIEKGSKFAKVGYGALKGMTSSAAKQKVENGEVDLLTTVVDGGVGAAGAGVGVKYDGLKPQSSSAGTDALIEGGKKATEKIVQGMGEVVKEEIKEEDTTDTSSTTTSE